MKTVMASSALALGLSLAACSSLPGALGGNEHAAHQAPQDAAGSATPGPYERQMQAMHEMHRKMAAARTPEERAALMKDHMKTMHEGMAMVGQMRGGAMGGGMGMGRGKGPMAMDAQTMQRRMDMMEMMMQMMLDRDGMQPPAGR